MSDNEKMVSFRVSSLTEPEGFYQYSICVEGHWLHSDSQWTDKTDAETAAFKLIRKMGCKPRFMTK